MVNIINEKVMYVTSGEDPISSNVYIIKGASSTWVYDVGANSESLREIEAIEGDVNIVISHFHADHIGNASEVMKRAGNTVLYASKQTSKYVQDAALVEEDFTVEDGVKFHVFRIPSSHAKGCLGLEVAGEYAFVGDAIYPSYKDNMKVYNVQLLKEQIEVLKGLRADKIFLSHDKKAYVKKNVVVSFLESVYVKRNSDSNFVYERLF